MKPPRLVDHLAEVNTGELPAPGGGCPLIGVLAGTGIGPEVVGAALQVLQAAGQALNLKFEICHGGLIGEDAIAEHGQWLPEETATFCADIFQRGGAILNGPGGGRYVYDLRRRFDLFCKFVPVRPGTGPRRKNFPAVFAKRGPAHRARQHRRRLSGPVG